MFNISYDELLSRALARVDTNLDMSEGSFLYDAIAPCVMELYQLYLYCDELEKRVYADTSYDEYLDRRTEERGIIRKSATYSVRKATFNTDVPINSRWRKEDLMYIVSSPLGSFEYLLTCTIAGTIGNKYSGELINVDAIGGVTSAELGEIIIYGEDEETDDQLRERYFSSFNNDYFGGNIADYKKKTLEISGVGQVKVYPCWDGVGTVKLEILNNNNEQADNIIIDLVKQTIDPTSDEGKGYGLAPIGHTVTVSTPNISNIDVKLSLEYNDGYTFDSVKENIENAINDYFVELLEEWSDTDKIIVRVLYIESKVLAVNGVKDVRSCLINNQMSNLTLTNEIPKLISVSEVVV